MRESTQFYTTLFKKVGVPTYLNQELLLLHYKYVIMIIFIIVSRRSDEFSAQRRELF